MTEQQAGDGTEVERFARFARTFSHDLKNPLTSLALSLESLELELTDDHHVEALARARRAADRIRALVDELQERAADGGGPPERS